MVLPRIMVCVGLVNLHLFFAHSSETFVSLAFQRALKGEPKNSQYYFLYIHLNSIIKNHAFHGAIFVKN